MPEKELTTRRVQFSSCDECRRERVGCDAGRARHKSSDPVDALLSCTRCKQRQRPCTFEWMKTNSRSTVVLSAGGRGKNKTTRKQKRSQAATDDRGSLLLPSDEQESVNASTASETAGEEIRESMEPGLSNSWSKLEDIVTPDLRKWLWVIYEDVFESVFGTWMGRHSNPFAFGEASHSDMCVSVYKLCIQLDRWMEEGYEAGGNPPQSSSPRVDLGTSNNLNADSSLDLAVCAFASRWLPLLDSSILTEEATLPIIRSLWRCAHRDMLKVINRPSYRSMLSLLLFALTPIPVGISEEEELDGASGQICVHAALQQIQTLRASQRSLQFNGTRVYPATRPRASSVSPHSLATANFINAESIAYWAALTFDTSASLTLNCRPLLSCGLYGFELDPPWRLVRSCLEVFRTMTKDWNGPSFELTDEMANQVIASGASWKLLVWKLTANLKEALRDGHDERELVRAFDSVSHAIDQFNATYRELLGECHKRIQFLRQDTKLRWYELILHYHLAILMVVDVLTATDHHELLPQFTTKRVEAESWVLNCLVFGLNNSYTLQVQGPPAHPQNEPDPVVRATATLIAVDPYPHHVVAAVKFMKHAILRDFELGKISLDAQINCLSTLAKALEQLPQCSKSVQSARADSRDWGGFESRLQLSNES